MDGSVLQAARAYVAGGVSVFPISRGGAGGWKSPASALLPLVEGEGGRRRSWNPFRERLPTALDLARWYDVAAPPGIAAACGAVSGGLELLDFDHEAEATFAAWCALVDEADPLLLARAAVVRSPKPGYHVWLRSRLRPVPPSQVLAADPARPPGRRKLIETRGEGGYGLVPGCPPECHETGRCYEHLIGPPLWDLVPLTAEERDTLVSAARSLDRTPPVPCAAGHPARGVNPVVEGTRPGDVFDARADWLSDVLLPAGWRVWRQQGGVTYLTRPGKGGGVSASLGKVRKGGTPLLHVFTSSTELEAGRTYGPFNALVALRYGGRHADCAKELYRLGYRDPDGGPARGSPRPQGHATNGLRSGPGAQAGQPAPAAAIILDHFRTLYRPDFRRGDAAHCAKGGVVRMAEACAGPTFDLLERLALAADAPQFKGGGVNRQALPAFFKAWSRAAWAELLAGLPAEDDPDAPDSPVAAEEFRRLLRDCFLTEFTLARTLKRGKGAERETRIENRSLIRWCEHFAKEGRWQSIRSKQCWCKLEVGHGGELLVKVAFRHGLLRQLKGDARLTGLSAEQFSRLARRYGAVTSGRDAQRVAGQRVLHYDQGEVNDLVRTAPEEAPEVDTSTSCQPPPEGGVHFGGLENDG